MRRRSLLVGTAVTLVAAGAGVHVLRGRVAGGEVRRPPGVPVGPFGRDSTAEEVTAGLSPTGRTALVTGRSLEKAKAACAALPGRTTPIALQLERWDTVAAAGLIGWTSMEDIPQGAATGCHVATAPASAGVSGYHFEDCGPVVPAPGKHMDDIDLAERSWARSQSLVKEHLA